MIFFLLLCRSNALNFSALFLSLARLVSFIALPLGLDFCIVAYWLYEVELYLLSESTIIDDHANCAVVIPIARNIWTTTQNIINRKFDSISTGFCNWFLFLSLSLSLPLSLLLSLPICLFSCFLGRCFFCVFLLFMYSIRCRFTPELYFLDNFLFQPSSR